MYCASKCLNSFCVQFLTSILVSGEPPKRPVFSKTTGDVFEKHLLEAYLTDHHTDPITNEPATADDYVELKGWTRAKIS